MDVTSKSLEKYKNYTIYQLQSAWKKSEERIQSVSTILDFAEIRYNSLFQEEDTLAQSKKTREERLKTLSALSIKGRNYEKRNI